MQRCLQAARGSAAPGPLARALLRYASSAAFQELPTVDVSALYGQDAAAKRRVGAALDDACRNVGFFYVSNHRVPSEQFHGVLAEARRWFALPEAVKSQIAISPQRHYRGYQALGTNVTRYDGGFQRDWHEAIDLYKEEDPSEVQARGLPASPIHGPNQWPSQLAGFTPLLQRYYASCQTLGSRIMTGIALGLGLPEDFFAGDRAGIKDSYWCSRIIHYPPLSEGFDHQGGVRQEARAALAGGEVARSVQLSCGEHTDYGLLTLVNQETHVTALQVKNAAGQWIDATPVPGTFVVNIGDMLKVWTNGRYMPTAHRVINYDPSRSRVSIPFFYEPCFETQVAPLPPLLGSSSPKFQPVRYGSHLESKVLRNFEL